MMFGRRRSNISKCFQLFVFSEGALYSLILFYKRIIPLKKSLTYLDLCKGWTDKLYHV